VYKGLNVNASKAIYTVYMNNFVYYKRIRFMCNRLLNHNIKYINCKLNIIYLTSLMPRRYNA